MEVPIMHPVVLLSKPHTRLCRSD